MISRIAACPKLTNVWHYWNTSLEIAYPPANVTWDDRITIGTVAWVTCIAPWKNDTTEIMFRTCDALDTWDNATLPNCRLS